jgi:pseudaminic acid synthase
LAAKIAHSFASVSPDEFKEMVSAVRDTEKVMGKVTYEVNDTDKMRKGSKLIVEDIKAGDIIMEKYVRSIRTEFGLHPRYLSEVLGKNVTQNFNKGDRFHK